MFQADLTLTSENLQPVYSGFNDYGSTINNIRTAYGEKGSNRDNFSNLSNKVLQFIYNGFTGFKFPVAHYPVTNMRAAELRHILMEVINALHQHGFKVIH